MLSIRLCSLSFGYNALFLKNIQLDRTFRNGWNSPVDENDEENDDDDEQQSMLFKRYAEEVNTWFEKEKPYLRDDLRLTDLQRVFPISRSYLSQLFNKELGMSFSDYVNQFTNRWPASRILPNAPVFIPSVHSAGHLRSKPGLYLPNIREDNPLSCRI